MNASWVRTWDDLPAWASEVFTEKQLTIPAVLRWQLCVRMLHCRPSTQHVGLVLSTYMTATDLEARPSISRLATDTGRKPVTVRHALAELQERGWLTITRKRNPSTGQHFTNEYRGARPEVVEVELHADGVRPMRLHQVGTCCQGWAPKGTEVGAKGDPPPVPKGTHPGTEGTQGVGAQGDPEVSIDVPKDLSKNVPDSSSLRSRDGLAPDGAESHKFELGKRYAVHVASGAFTDDDVAQVIAQMEPTEKTEFLKGFQEGAAA